MTSDILHGQPHSCTSEANEVLYPHSNTAVHIAAHNRQGNSSCYIEQAHPDVCVHHCCDAAAHPRNVEQLESPYYQCVGVCQQWLEDSRQMD